MLYLAIDHARKNRRPRIVYWDANELGSITILCVSCEPLLPRRRTPGASERYPLELKTYILRARNALSRLAMGTSDVPSTKSRKARHALNLLLFYDDLPSVTQVVCARTRLRRVSYHFNRGVFF